MSRVNEMFGLYTNGEEFPDLHKVLISQICPFTGSRCYKTRKSDPGTAIGTCSLCFNNVEQPILICPEPLTQGGKVFNDCLSFIASSIAGTDLYLVPEVSTPAGRIDYVLTAVKNGRPVDFVAIELQTLDTTGSIWNERQSLLIEHGYDVDKGAARSNGASLNWKMTAKTILAQLLQKSQLFASIDQQREQAQAFAKAHGYNIVKEYEDAAMSGTTSDRPQYQLMLSEVGTIRPAAVILWKTDRLGRDRFELADAKRRIRDAGCRICLIAEPTPDDSPESVLMETMMEGMAEFYSRQLSVNIRRGMAYNAEHALYNGHRVWGYGVDDEKHYVVDDSVAPFVLDMFTRYADGEAMQSICDDFNAKGLRTTRGALFGVKTMNKLLKNRAYIGEYRHGGVTVEGGMPQIVDEELFDRAQRRLAENKRNGSRRKASVQAQDAPRYWLMGKLYCGECGGSMQGVSGTSKTGAKHYYYYCKEQRAKRPVRKEWIEDAVTGVLKGLLDDSENLASIAVDAAKYYEDNYKSTEYLSSLEQQRRDVEKGLANFVKAIEAGIFNEATQRRMAELQERKDALNDAIEAETVRQSLFEDEHSIRAYFDRFLHADFDNPEVRDSVLEYFVDKIYLYEDRLVVTSWYSDDNRKVPMEVLNGEAEDPFAEGEAVKFDCFPFGSTRSVIRSYTWPVFL